MQCKIIGKASWTQCCCISSADGVDLVPLRTTLSAIGKFGITGAFSIVFLYTPEIFPTSLRYRSVAFLWSVTSVFKKLILAVLLLLVVMLPLRYCHLEVNQVVVNNVFLRCLLVYIIHGTLFSDSNKWNAMI